MSLKENDVYYEKKLEECEYCGGMGEVTVMERDADSHEYAPTGTQKCICQIVDENDYEPIEQDR